MFSETSDKANALEARGINPQTELPDNVTLSGDATSVRFHSSKKTGGYIKKEVDEYIVNVIAPSLEWFKSALERRDQEVYRLGHSIEELESTVMSLNRDIESVNMNNMVLTSKRENQDDKEMAALMSQNAELRRRVDELSYGSASSAEYDEILASYKANEEAFQGQIAEMTEYISQLESQLLSLQAGSDGDSSTQLQAALEKCSLMEKDLAEFQTYVDEIQEYTNGLEEKVSSLEAEVANGNTESANTAELQRRMDEAEKSAIAHSQHAEELLRQSQAYSSELEQRNTEIASLQETIQQLNNQPAEETEDYEGAYNTVASQLAELQEQTATASAQYEQRIAEVESELNEAIERATEYYEHYLALQQQIDTNPVPLDSGDSLIKTRNTELSTQLDQVQQELAETQTNYAALYEAYEEITASIPESGIVSMEDYASVKVAYDEANSELTTAQKTVEKLEKQLASHEQGLISEGVTLENYKSLQEALDAANYDNRELKLKYDTLLSRKDAPPASDQTAASSDEVTYSEEEYTTIYTHATEAIEQYNELVGVHEELREAYEELRVAYEGLAEEVRAKPAAATSKKKAGLPTASKIAPEEKETLPESKYSEKKLPEGITLEDLV